MSQCASRLGVLEDCQFEGPVPEEELQATIRNATLLLYVSLAEGFGLPLLDAFSFGIPVVASATSSIPEVCGGAATLVDPADAHSIASGVRAVLESPRLQSKMSRLGLTRARAFSWRSSAERYAELMARVAVGPER
jgi:glycosyltransferase involved in cell wall biosynthesis